MANNKKNYIKDIKNKLNNDTSFFIESEEAEYLIDYFIEENQLDLAIKLIKVSDELYPKNETFRLKKAIISYYQQNYNDTINILEYKMDYENTDSHLWDIYIRSIFKSLDNTRITKLYNYIIENEYNFDDINIFDIKILFYNKLVKTKNYNLAYSFSEHFDINSLTFVIYDYCKTFEKLNKYEEAVNNLEKLKRVNSNTSNIWFIIGQFYLYFDEDEKAMDAFEFYRILKPKDLYYNEVIYEIFYYKKYNLCINFGLNVLYDLRKHFKSKNNKNNNLECDDNLYIIYKIMGDSFYKMKMYESAYLYYNYLYTQNHKIQDDKLLNKLLFCNSKSKQYDKSCKIADKIFESNKNDILNSSTKLWYLAKTYYNNSIKKKKSINFYKLFLNNIDSESQFKKTDSAIIDVVKYFIEIDNYTTAKQFIDKYSKTDNIEIRYLLTFIKFKLEIPDYIYDLETCIKQDRKQIKKFLNYAFEILSDENVLYLLINNNIIYI